MNVTLNQTIDGEKTFSREERRTIVRIINDEIGKGSDLPIIIRRVSEIAGEEITKHQIEYIYNLTTNGSLKNEIEWAASIKKEYGMSPDEYIISMNLDTLRKNPDMILRKKQGPRSREYLDGKA